MKLFYIILAALMLLCLAPMPYGYFQFVRYIAMVAFAVIAYQYYSSRKLIAATVFVSLAVLFQPIYKVALGRALWNVVDVIVAVLLIALFFLERKQEQKVYITDNPQNPEGQQALEDNRLEFSLEGKLAPDEMVYVASEEDRELTELFERRHELLEGWGQMIGLHVIYLPLLIKKLRDKRVLQYRAPYLNDTELSDVAIGNDYFLKYLENPKDKDKVKHGFIRTEDIHKGDDGKDRATNRFYPLSSMTGEPLADQLHRIGKQIAAEKVEQGRLLEQQFDDWGDAGNTYADNCFNSQIGEENTDDLLEEVRERIAKLRQRGISQYILEQLIHPEDRVSRLVITKDFRLLLPDYQNMEIKMEPLVKAVYLLFLRHPEGIVFKNLPDYRRELTKIYSEIRPSGLTDRALQSIEDVTNPMLNSINEKCARIRGAFVGQFDDHMARHYYIDGLRGKAKKVSLPRDLVLWE